MSLLSYLTRAVSKYSVSKTQIYMADSVKKPSRHCPRIKGIEYKFTICYFTYLLTGVGVDRWKPQGKFPVCPRCM